MKGNDIMPEHDNTTALPDPNLIGDEPKQSSSLPENDDQSVELAAEDTVSPSANTTEVLAPKDIEVPAQTESRQGSGAVPARQSVPLSVSAGDPKAFGASLDDIATGRVTVRFDV
jgi:hypothetical protein